MKTTAAGFRGVSRAGSSERNREAAQILAVLKSIAARVRVLGNDPDQESQPLAGGLPRSGTPPDSVQRNRCIPEGCQRGSKSTSIDPQMSSMRYLIGPASPIGRLQRQSTGLASLRDASIHAFATGRMSLRDKPPATGCDPIRGRSLRFQVDYCSLPRPRIGQTTSRLSPRKP